MSEGKGLQKKLDLQPELAAFMKAPKASRTEIIQALWKHIKDNKLQTKTVNGTGTGSGKNIVADAVLHPMVKKTKSTSKSGKVTDLTSLKEGETFDMMALASVIGANLA